MKELLRYKKNPVAINKTRYNPVNWTQVHDRIRYLSTNQQSTINQQIILAGVLMYNNRIASR